MYTFDLYTVSLYLPETKNIDLNQTVTKANYIISFIELT